MTTLTSGLRRALRVVTESTDSSMHFHVGGDGSPFVCDIARCDSPGLTLDEASRAQARFAESTGRDALAA